MAESSVPYPGTPGILWLRSLLAPRGEHLAVGSYCLDPHGSRPSVSHGISSYCHLRTKREIARANFPLHQRARPFGLEAPRGHRAVFIRHVYQQPRMRVGVLKLFHRTFERDLLCAV